MVTDLDPCKDWVDNEIGCHHFWHKLTLNKCAWVEARDALKPPTGHSGLCGPKCLLCPGWEALPFLPPSQEGFRRVRSICPPGGRQAPLCRLPSLLLLGNSLRVSVHTRARTVCSQHFPSTTPPMAPPGPFEKCQDPPWALSRFSRLCFFLVSFSPPDKKRRKHFLSKTSLSLDL